MSIREHGGAVRYWVHKVTGKRAVLCADGELLVMVNGRWRVQMGSVLSVGWETDTRPNISAAITRTTREARRRAGNMTDSEITDPRDPYKADKADK